MYYKVYLLLAHKKPKQLAALITLLQDERSLFFIHLDKKVDVSTFNFINTMANTYFIEKRAYGNWGGFGIVEATLNGMKEIADFMQTYNDQANYHCIILSGEDLPLKSNESLTNYLTENQTHSFIHHWKLPYKDWWNGGFFRFESLYAFDFNTHKKAHNLLNKVIKKLGMNFLLPINRFKKAYPDLEFYGSSQWMILSKELTNSIVKASETHLKLKRLFKYVLLPDELYIITLIFNFLKPESLLVKNIPSHLIVFNGNDANPQYLNKEVIEEHMHGSYCFARKFDSEINGDAIAYIKEKLTI